MPAMKPLALTPLVVTSLLVGAVQARAFQASILTDSRPLMPQQPDNIMSLRKNRIPSSTGGSTPMGLRGGSTPSSSTSLKSSAFNNGPLWRGSGIIVAANALGYAINLVFGPSAHYHVDLLGTGAFAAAALPTFLNSPNNKRIVTSSAAVMAWSVKLASFLLFRVIQNGHDSRLDDVLATPSSAAGFWLVSAAWGLCCSLPHALGTTSRLAGNAGAIRAGTALFGVGWILETLADYQKWSFKQGHPGQFCNVGLWSVSQHPNWFGNLVLWSGIFVMNAPALIEPTTVKSSSAAATGLWRKLWSYRRVALALLGPAFMWTLFHAQATGKILEDSFQAANERYGYGKDLKYTNYIDNTPLIIPNPLKWFTS